MVVARNDTPGTVEHGRVDVPADALGREQEALFALHGGHHGGPEPAVERVGQFAVARLDGPGRAGRIDAGSGKGHAPKRAGQLHGHDVALAAPETTHQFGGVTAHLYPQRHPQRLGKPLAEHVLHAQAAPVVIVVSVGTGESEHDEFAVVHNVVQAESSRLGKRVFAHYGAPGSGLPV